MQYHSTRSWVVAIALFAAAFLIPAMAQAELIETKIGAELAAGGDFFGWSVAISGGVAIIGARSVDTPFIEAGSAYLFNVDPSSPEFGTQIIELKASDPSEADFFGWSVAIDGGVAIVGAPGNQNVGGDRTGSVYLFDASTGSPISGPIFASDGAHEDFFGSSVGISGNRAIVGASSTEDVGGVFNSGSAYLFDVNPLSPTFGQEVFTPLTASNAATDDFFGTSVAISGDLAIVGAPFSDGAGNDSGSAYMFDVTTGLPIGGPITASDVGGGDFFGFSVGISGNRAIVGATRTDGAGTDSGSAYLFDGAGQEISGVNPLTASDAAASDEFGYSVGISGTRAIVGSRTHDGAGSNSGSAYLFDVITGQELPNDSPLTADDAAAGDVFGLSVGISGSKAIVGAIGDDDAGSNSGSAYLFVGPPPQRVVLAWGEASDFGIKEQQDEFGHTITVLDPTVSHAAIAGTPYGLLLEIFKSQFRTGLESTFADAGVTSIEFVNGPSEPGAMTVYMLDGMDASAPPGIAGASSTNQFNSNPEEKVLVFLGVESFNEDLASAAHEIGHAMGLQHIDPPGSEAIMDYDQAAGFQSFTDGVFSITEPPEQGGQVLPITHNPVYHLQRYVEHVVPTGTPGTYDLPENQQLTLQLLVGLGFGDPAGAAPQAQSAALAPATTLYDVMILEANGDPQKPDVLAEFAAITLADLEQEQFSIGRYSALGLLAASTPGGAHDIALALGDPFASDFLVMYPGLDELQGSLQMATGVPGGFDTLATVNISATLVPEPSALTLAALALVGLLAHGRRRRA